MQVVLEFLDHAFKADPVFAGVIASGAIFTIVRYRKKVRELGAR